MSVARAAFVCMKPVLPTVAASSSAPQAARRAAAPPLPAANEADLFALEEALRARDRGEVERVIGVAVGPPRAREALVAALAIGADHAVRIELAQDVGLDAGATAALLAALIRSRGGRLVFAAQASDDGRSGLVPAFLARHLDAAYLSNAATARLAEDEVEIQRRLERGGRQVWRAVLPAVVACDAGINVPRYPRVAARLRARHHTIDETSPSALGVDLGSLPRPVAILRLEPLRRRPKKIAMPAPQSSAADRMRALVGGGVTAKASKVIAGSVDQLVATTISFLRERRLLDPGHGLAVGTTGLTTSVLDQRR